MFWLVLSVIAWGFMHSLLASLKTKAWFRQKLGDFGMRFYRLGYNVFSLVSFLPVPWLMVMFPDRILYQIREPWLYLTLTGQILSMLMLVVGVLQTDVIAFIGIRQLFESGEPEARIVVGGLYRWVRHPLYTAGLLFIWLTPVMSQNEAIVFSVLTIYIIVGAYYEERKLRREFGRAYSDYQAITPMFIPGLYFGRKK